MLFCPSDGELRFFLSFRWRTENFDTVQFIRMWEVSDLKILRIHQVLEIRYILLGLATAGPSRWLFSWALFDMVLCLCSTESGCEKRWKIHDAKNLENRVPLWLVKPPLIEKKLFLLSTCSIWIFGSNWFCPTINRTHSWEFWIRLTSSWEEFTFEETQSTLLFWRSLSWVGVFFWVFRDGVSRCRFPCLIGKIREFNNRTPKMKSGNTVHTQIYIKREEIKLHRTVLNRSFFYTFNFLTQASKYAQKSYWDRFWIFKVLCKVKVLKQFLINNIVDIHTYDECKR